MTKSAGEIIASGKAGIRKPFFRQGTDNQERQQKQLDRTDQKTFHESSLEKDPEKTRVDQISFMRLTAKGKKSNPLKPSDGYNDGVLNGHQPPFDDKIACQGDSKRSACLLRIPVFSGKGDGGGKWEEKVIALESFKKFILTGKKP